MSEPIDSGSPNMLHQGHQLALRIAQCYPFQTVGLDLTTFDIDFVDSPMKSGMPIAEAVYDTDGTLQTINVNSVTLGDQYDRLRHDVTYDELAGVHVGIGICMDLLFRQLRDGTRKGVNITDAMADQLVDTERIERALLGVDAEFRNNAHLKSALTLLLNQGDDGPERVARINAQRIALGMFMESEKMYDGETGFRVAAAVRDDIREHIKRSAGINAVLARALTNNDGLALRNAADAVLSANDLPLAIPANCSEIDKFFHAIQVANIRPELMSTAIVNDLAGIEPVLPDEDEMNQAGFGIHGTGGF